MLRGCYHCYAEYCFRGILALASTGGNAIISVRPSVRLFPLSLLNIVTFDLVPLSVYRSYHSSHKNEGQGQRSRLWLGLASQIETRSMRHRSPIEDCFSSVT